jgi:hypothetical protein
VPAPLAILLGGAAALALLRRRTVATSSSPALPAVAPSPGADRRAGELDLTSGGLGFGSITPAASSPHPTSSKLPPAAPPSPLTTAGATIGAKVGAATGVPGAGALTGAVGATIGNAASKIAAGDGSAIDFGTVAFLPVAATRAVVDAIAGLFAGKPLDPVNDLLFNEINPAQTDRNNVQWGRPIYVLATDGLHQITNPDLNAAGFSWRAVIAVSRATLDSLGPASFPITSKSQIVEVGRPSDPAVLRAALGSDAIFKIGADAATLYGPWNAPAAAQVAGGHAVAASGTTAAVTAPAPTAATHAAPVPVTAITATGTRAPRAAPATTVHTLLQ